MSEKERLAWAEANRRKGTRGWEYPPFVCHIMNLFDTRARDRGCQCEWVPPYGFVIEAGCPKHD